ncbi:lysosomal acid phosphatase-like protein 3 [Leptotrombidium deliense]|uniref:acid phosphatase n=1 Tax=Leptotrombidium deliense TaxID=299467 RepID=A0A443S2Q1_9ACAR|nr:lysosomal acid phosphatase-like protein 3 [Leptotrombidium deliense]
MLVKIFTFAFGVFLVSANFIYASENNLRSVHRHGDRNARFSYPNDPNLNNWLTLGLGAVTEPGEKRMETLGQYFRKRYNTFWNPKKDIYVRTSRLDRCVKSVQNLITGAYNEYFLANPVPVESVQFEVDNMLNPMSKCPAFDNEFLRVLNLPENLKWFNSIKPLILYIAKYCGPSCVTNVETFFNVFDNLKISKLNNWTLPNWVTEDIYNQFETANNRIFVLFGYSTLQQRLTAGTFLNELKNQMNLIQSYKKFDKLRIYSTQDIQISSILRSLDVFNEIAPPFGTTIIFEFYQNFFPREEFFRIYYLNDTYSQHPYPLVLKSCKENEHCSFTKLNNQIENLIPDDWRKECGLK